ncbi:helix-turn-helix domain-containing protein [Microbacterium paraoxydans]|uniref:helix-turn-helix domain-containing protein n=1 Tax=Microbacterium paraoxydans TaxID=199592 RepID=UPI0037CC1487
MENWPDQRAADHSTETARGPALNLRAALAGKSVRALARESGIDEGTIRRVLAGSVWAALRTISSLENALGIPLYPRLEWIGVPARRGAMPGRASAPSDTSWRARSTQARTDSSRADHTAADVQTAERRFLPGHRHPPRGSSGADLYIDDI